MEMTAPQRAAIADTWHFRYVGELSAVKRFRRLAQELATHDAPQACIDLATRAIEDETRHAALCLELALDYGFGDPATAERVVAPRLAPGHLSGPQALTYEVVAFCCLTESINTAMLVETLTFAVDERIRSAVRTILRDEVNHSKLGWAYLAHESEGGRVAFLGDALETMLEQLDIATIMTPTGLREGPGFEFYGELDDARRFALFRHTIFDVVLKGLEHFGVDTRRARSCLARYGVQPPASGEPMNAPQSPSL